MADHRRSADPALRGPRPRPARPAHAGRAARAPAPARRPRSPGVGLGPFRTGDRGAARGRLARARRPRSRSPSGLAATWDADLLERVGDRRRHRGPGQARRRPDRLAQRLGTRRQPAAAPALGTQRGGVLRGPAPHRASWPPRTPAACAATTPCTGGPCPTLKHLVAYGNETDRSVTSAQLSPRVLHEYELPAFRGPIEAGVVGAVMPSYNLVNGRPNHVARELLDEVRGWTQASLLVVSDAGAPTNLVTGERYYDDHVEAAAAAVRAGVDSFTDHDADPTRTARRTCTAALERGLLDQADVDRAALRQLELRLAHRRAGPRPRPVGVDRRARPRPARAAARSPARRSRARSSCWRTTACCRCARARASPSSDRTPTRCCTDWYSGTPPYTGLDRRARSAPADVVTGADTVALRSRHHRRLRRRRRRRDPRRDRPRPPPTTTSPTGARASSRCASAATGLLWTGAGWILRADAPRRRTAGSRRRASARTGTTTAPSRCSTRARAAGSRCSTTAASLVAEAASADDRRALHAAHRRLRGRPGGRGGAPTPTSSCSPSATTRTCSAARPRTARTCACRSRRPSSRRAVLEANPATVARGRLVLPVRARRARRRRRGGRVDLARRAGARATASPTCSPATAEPSGRLAQTWPEAEEDAGDLLDYDVIGGGLTHWYAPRPAAVGVRARPDLHRPWPTTTSRGVPRRRPGDRAEHRRPPGRRAGAGVRGRARSTGCRCRTADWSRTAGSTWRPGGGGRGARRARRRVRRLGRHAEPVRRRARPVRAARGTVVGRPAAGRRGRRRRRPRPAAPAAGRRGPRDRPRRPRRRHVRGAHPGARRRPRGHARATVRLGALPGHRPGGGRPRRAHRRRRRVRAGRGPRRTRVALRSGRPTRPAAAATTGRRSRSPWSGSDVVDLRLVLVGAIRVAQVRGTA